MAATRRPRSVSVSSTSTVTARAATSTRADATPGRGASAPSIECLQWSQWISGTLMVIVVIWSLHPRWPIGWWLGLEQPLDRLGGLGHDRVAVHLALAADGVAHAMAQVVIQQQHRHPTQGGVDRRNLGEDVDAVGVLIDQPLQAADLTLNPSQTQLHLILVRRIAPHPQPPHAIPP